MSELSSSQPKCPVILYVFAGLDELGLDSLFTRMFECLSQCFKGYVITPVKRPELLRHKRVGNFRLCTYLCSHKNILLRNLVLLLKTVKLGMKVSGYHVIVCRNPLAIGLAGVALKSMTGAKLVVEVNGEFKSSFRFSKLNLSTTSKLKERLSDLLIPFVLKRSDLVKLLYEAQIDPYNLSGIKTVCFPDLTTTTDFFSSKKEDGKYVLFIGGPWFLKGVDILISAFKKIADKFPEYRLKIYGWTWQNEKDYFLNLAKHDPRIELRGPIPRKEVVEVMAKCSLFVLPSRTEAMGRVLIEAMASKKPVIASNVGGIPSIVKHNFNGLLFNREDVDDLAEKMSLVLRNKELAIRLSENAYWFTKKFLSEEAYLKNFKKMIKNIGKYPIATV